MISSFILLSVLITSVVSGVIGMAGGMILMAVLVSALSVSGAMMLHGAIQATANGSRAIFLRAHIQWRVLPPYVAGAAVALAFFLVLALVPAPGLVLLLLGALPWLGRAVPPLRAVRRARRRNQPHLRGLNICQPATAFGCGVVITGAQLMAGASGPLLDLFYLNAPLNRHQVVASKALTQTLGHVIKLGYYATVALTLTPEGVPLWLYAAAIATAVIGTRVGTRLLDRLAEATFRRASQWIILAIATVCLITGTWQLAAN